MKLNKIVFLLLCPLLSFGQINIVRRSTVTTYPQYPEVGTQKFIGLFGQSNACGIVNVSSAPYSGLIDNAYILNLCLSTPVFQQLNVGTNNWLYLSSVCATTDYGIEVQLMHDLGVLYGQPQYMLKYGYTGTSMANTSGTTPNWNVFAANQTIVNDARFEIPGLYGTALNYLNIAQNRIPVLNKKLEWIVWMQGEQDANGGSTLYNNYQTNLTDFINTFRTQSHLGTNLKFLLVQLSSNQTGINATGKTAVNTAMTNIAGSLTNVFTVSPNGTVQGDGIHYDAAGLATVATSVYNTIIAN